MADNPRLNSEGYYDPTAYHGLRNIIRNIIREENAVDYEVSTLIKVLKYIINRAGFELVSRIELKDKKSGRVFK